MKRVTKEPRVPVVVGDQVIVDGCHTRYRPTVREIIGEVARCSMTRRGESQRWKLTALITVAQWERNGRPSPKTPKRSEKEW